MKTIGLRLKDARGKKKWSQKQLAAASGVSPGTIGNIESGQRENPRELLAIAEALGVAPQWLKTGKGPRYIEGAEAPAPDDPAMAAVKHLAALLVPHSPTRRRSIADLLSRLATEPENDELATDVVVMLKLPPADFDPKAA